METNNWMIIGLVVLSLLFWRGHNKLTNKISNLNYEISSLENEKNDYEDALDQANSNIEDAQSYAWSSYDEMGYALDDLETVNP